MTIWIILGALWLLICLNFFITWFLAWSFLRDLRAEEKRLKEEDELFEHKKKPIDLD